MGEIVAFQDEFRQVLPNVTGNVDYMMLQRFSEYTKRSYLASVETLTKFYPSHPEEFQNDTQLLIRNYQTI